MHILITGGAGFLGQRLARQLLQNPDVRSLTLADITPPPGPTDPRVTLIQTDLTAAQSTRNLISPKLTAIYHLAAVVSGQAEANFDLGMAVNCDGTRHLLEAVRHNAPGAMFIFASSLAVFGGELPAVISDSTAVLPQSSYGTQKAISELWVKDYTRKGFIDGRVLRLPTVCVRPGKPNAATSSFASSIIREPSQGKTAVCPVDPRLRLWLSSPNAVIDNLVHTLTVSADTFGNTRTVNLPGITVSVQDMIDALKRVVGPTVVQKIRHQPDETISRIVGSWPSDFAIGRAIDMGFTSDRTFDDIIQTFINEKS